MKTRSVVSLTIKLFIGVLLSKGIQCTNWNEIAKESLKNALKLQPNTGIAQNVIVFVGDGMGLSTINAARIYKGQKQGKPGEETILEFEKFPHVALSKVYGTDKQVPESAQTATALFCGVKTNFNILGLRDSVGTSDCNAQKTQGKTAEVSSIVRHAIEQGKSTGVVTTTRITHATPAATYAHAAHRDWESDADINSTLHGDCKDIALQLINDNHDIQVVLGGGRRAFLPVTVPDPETNAIGVNKRLDGRNLIETWETIQQGKSKNYRYVWRKQDFDAVDENNIDYLLGLFNPAHMEYELERDTGNNGEPSLTEMTAKAIKILRRNKKGFVLVVEGGRIDHAHHDNKAKKALEEAVQFDEAIKEAVSLTSQKETLIIVTADHSHPFSLTGYTNRGNDILGLVDEESFKVEPTTDHMPYSSLLYGNGPGYRSPRQNLTGINTDDKDFMQQSAVPLEFDTHSGEDVGIFARGPMSHLFHGVHEQHYVSHVVQYAACLGDYSEDCDYESRH
ncbi:alkaline phosphatase, tissue-nonspecific isozyme-like isoform X2 [Saccostrea echinata]|uniref:alkaline phosphatase, tissue-nonspecific isozyme-like isoform X2 n=1 Tax=Saccostrea echinata TaxID=191078 RepID=UPI002A825C14|nr:alkaline phosphatase, tissue-nonspecific isozyme-like isoform X2 [Saccostrea echinata]